MELLEARDRRIAICLSLKCVAAQNVYRDGAAVAGIKGHTAAQIFLCRPRIVETCLIYQVAVWVGAFICNDCFLLPSVGE